MTACFRPDAAKILLQGGSIKRQRPASSLLWWCKVPALVLHWDCACHIICIFRALQASWTFVGHALWLDKAHSQCLVLWKRLPEWADIIYTFAQTYGLDDSVMTVDDLSDSEDTANTGRLRKLAPAACLCPASL